MEEIIRPWRPEDAPALARTIGNPRLRRYLSGRLPDPYTEDDARAFIHLMNTAGDGAYGYAVVYGGECVGSVTITRGEDIFCRSGELGCYVAEELWGRGLATRAVRAACERVWAGSDLLRIYAQAFAPNAASLRVLEKAGFTHEGTLRSAVFKQGEAYDLEVWGLLRPEAAL